MLSLKDFIARVEWECEIECLCLSPPREKRTGNQFFLDGINGQGYSDVELLIFCFLLGVRLSMEALVLS